uniref:photosystem I subunit VIII n=1 Tax=Helleborus foetidus TaxID=46996 RepID=UPI0025A946B7|nr:photosystem I subunit VIII [Helleborus foetidus]WIW41463.1 photosystem I subunit VIII [Helleborus foetidus]
MTTFNLPAFFCSFSGSSISGNCNGFSIYSCSKKQDCIDSMRPNLIHFFQDFDDHNTDTHLFSGHRVQHVYSSEHK